MKQYPFNPTPESEIRTRLASARQLMINLDIDALFLTHKPDIYYFSGTAQDCYLYLPKDNDPVLFVKRYLPRAQAETSIEHIEPIASIKEIPQHIESRQKQRPKTYGIAFDVVPVKDYLFYQKLFSSSDLVDAAPVIQGCRQIKSDWEIEQMEHAARVSMKTFDYMAERMIPGISEMEFCGRFESFSRTLGHSGKLLTRHYQLEGFPFHMLSGKNGGLPGALDSPLCGTGTSIAYPYGAGPKILEEDEPILIDFGTLVNGYHIDETRMFVMGRMPEEALTASEASIEILNRIKEIMKPGILISQIFDAAIETAEIQGLGDQFLGLPDLKSKFIGHGIGLELVEEPVLAKGRNQIIEPGMVFAVEPKFIFKDRFAAGIESMIHVTESGSRFLSLTENKIFNC